MENFQKYSTHNKANPFTSKKNSSKMYENDTFMKQFPDFYTYVKPMYSIYAKKKNIIRFKILYRRNLFKSIY